jgi:hypothetical protein
MKRIKNKADNPMLNVEEYTPDNSDKANASLDTMPRTEAFQLTPYQEIERSAFKYPEKPSRPTIRNENKKIKAKVPIDTSSSLSFFRNKNRIMNMPKNNFILNNSPNITPA